MMADENRDRIMDFIEKILGVNDQTNPSMTYAVSIDEIYWILKKTLEVVKKQPIMLEVTAPIKICGDVHGQYTDLLRIFNRCGYPYETPYLFLGDYVDRGRQQIEVICLLMGFKVLLPEAFFLLRGNHECSSINKTYGFYDEVKRRYKTTHLYDAFQELFNWLPLCALVSGRIFCMHGGISPHLTSWEQLGDAKIIRPLEPAARSIASDLLWSDPDANISGWEKNGRGVSYVFGEDVTKEFCRKMDIDLIVRGHQVVQDGYQFFADRHLVTVFSAPRYCGEFDNSAAVLNITDDLEIAFTILKPRTKPPKFVSRKRRSQRSE